MSELKNEIWRLLTTVTLPGSAQAITSRGIVQQVAECEGIATVTLDSSRLSDDLKPEVEARIRAAIGALPGLRLVNLLEGEPVIPRPRMSRETRLAHPSQGPRELEGVRHVLAVGSGKGGVGKSTVAVNLAVALAQQGLSVGLLDADAYGPNVPRMMGVEKLPPARGGTIAPAEAHGVRLVSIGLLVDPGTPVVWRGPMTDKMVRQFLEDVTWGELDVLVVDLPPTTGDIPMSLAKHARVDGAILVATPQGVAVDDARKAIGMFRRLGVPVLGIVENMSYFICEECGARHILFGTGGGLQLAADAEVPFLGKVPLETIVREGGDQGLPAVLQPGSRAGVALASIASGLWQALSNQAAASEEWRLEFR